MANTTRRQTITADSSAVTNTITETAFDKTLTIKANSLQKRHHGRFWALVKAPSTNSTDTLLCKLKLGSTVIAKNTAFDVANDDCVYLTADVYFDPANAEYHFAGRGSVNAGTAPLTTAGGDTSGTFSSDITVSCTATWSVASASNSCTLKAMGFEIYPED